MVVLFLLFGDDSKIYWEIIFLVQDKLLLHWKER